MRQIRPIDNNGSIQLKFSVSGKRYSFNPVPGGHFGTPEDMSTAIAVGIRIQNDLRADCFDSTLERYRIVTKAAKAAPKTALELFDRYLATFEQPKGSQHYRWLKRHLEKAKPGLYETDWLTKADLAAATVQKRISMLRAAYEWAKTDTLVAKNPYDRLRYRGPAPKPIQVFTKAETRALLAAFDSHYVPFVSFLFLTGCRLSEAIGLTWQHIEADSLTISESLSIDQQGNGYQRRRKQTKTGSVRTLPLSDSLRSVLGVPGKPNSLVFTTVQGCPIASRNFRERQWTEGLEAARVPYRKIHTIRHTFASQALEQGISFVGLAYLLGHKDLRMVVRTYGHLVDRPGLPDMGL